MGQASALKQRWSKAGNYPCRNVHRGHYRIKMPGHPRGNTQSYVFEHIIVAERALGRLLEVGHPVHHADENGLNNANTNLVICENAAYHALLHARMRILKAGGDPNADRICCTCKKLKALTVDFGKNRSRPDGREYQCSDCKSRRGHPERKRRRAL